MADSLLDDRSLIRIEGPDARHFLHNLVTADIEGLPEGEAWPVALLTPQGKILFDALIWRQGERYVIEIDRAQADAFARRLSMYKLRAKVEIAPPEPATIRIGDAEPAPVGAVIDHRFAVAGVTLWRLPGPASASGSREAYDRLRIASGIAEAGPDYALSDAFPHDVLFDRSGGVSFRKGCYVGQEVVSRMQHRSTARRRVVIVEATGVLPETGTPLLADGREAGRLGTVIGEKALAIARIDRIGETIARGGRITAGEVEVSVRLPDWTGLAFPAEAEAEP